MKFRIHPVLEKGIRVQYVDANSATKAGVIHARTGNKITIINALKQRARVDVDKIQGYWNPRVKASPQNMINLKETGDTDVENNKRTKGTDKSRDKRKVNRKAVHSRKRHTIHK